VVTEGVTDTERGRELHAALLLTETLGDAVLAAQSCA
jgi:hypothetical protein